jgi:hypothetical protein
MYVNLTSNDSNDHLTIYVRLLYVVYIIFGSYDTVSTFVSVLYSSGVNSDEYVVIAVEDTTVPRRQEPDKVSCVQHAPLPYISNSQLPPNTAYMELALRYFAGM